MPDQRTCPQCGAERTDDSLSGLCPKCLARYSFLELEGQADAAGRKTIRVQPESDLEVECTGLMIGRYKLLEQIGEGGFGLVYMAEQVEPVQRKVALKVIKAGMDTKAVVARFEAERQALALMDHPNIARVLDAGTTQAGRPYFVMELVRGIPITEFCDQHRLSPAERLELFMTVCRAVQHAHQKGIIHRDLKPGNVLVSSHDGKPVPKIIDFGVAKALGQRLTDKTLFTGFTHMIGTPAYMSPEQAELSGLDVDTRCDIYSLGVLLYELLTGVTPFDRETLAKAALDEVRRMIRETEPPKPSTRLRTLGKTLTQVAESRQTDAPKLIHLVRGDLDWIVMKCLEKDRTRRYETANGVAMDVKRHLENEPVVARPPSKLYEFQKSVKRHKFGFIAAGSVMAALAVGLAVATVAWVREREARGRAIAAESRNEQLALQEAKQRRQAEASERVAQEAREKAESRAYILQIARVGTLWQDVPGQARTLLEDQKVCPPKRREFCWRLLHHLLHPERLTIDTGDAFIASLAITPDGKQIVSADRKGLLSVWNALDGSLVWFTTLTNVWWFIFDFTPEGNQVVYTDEGSIIFRDLAAGAVQRKWNPDQLNPKGVRVGQRSGRIVFADGQQLYLWNPSTGDLSSFPHQFRTPTIEDFVISPQEKYVASAAQGDEIVRLWDMVRLEEVASFDEQWHPHHLAFSERTDPLMLSSVGWNSQNRVYVRDLDTLKTIKRLRSNVMALHTQFGPDGEYLLVSDRLGRLLRFGLADDETAFAVLGGHREGDVYGLDISPGGDWIASGDSRGTIHTWPVDPHPYDTALLVHHGDHEALGLAWDADGRGVYSVGAQPLLQYTDAHEWTTNPIVITDEGEQGYAMALSPDQRLIAVAESGGMVHVLERTSRRPVHTLDFVGGTVRTLAFSTDGRTLAVAGQGKTIELYDTVSWQLTESLVEPFGLVYTLAYSPDGRWLFAGGTGGDGPHVAFVWPLQPRLGDPRRLWEHAQQTRDAVFSRDGRTLITANADQTLIVWDVGSWKPRFRLHGHKNLIFAVALSPDDRTLASSDADGLIQLWDLASGTPVLTLSLPTPGTHAHDLAFDPKGDTLAAIASDGTLVTWNARPPEGIVFTREQTMAVRSQYAKAHFAPDGTDMDRWLRMEEPGGLQNSSASGH